MSHPYYPTWLFFFQVRRPGRNCRLSSRGGSIYRVHLSRVLSAILGAGIGLPTGLAVPVLETGSPGPAGFAGAATGLAVPVLETGKGGGKAGTGNARIDNPPLLG